MNSGLCRLSLANIRNLQAINLHLGTNFNLFCGPNGSGKTSLLEAVNLLSVGRSFRARTVQQLISFGTDSCLVRGMLGPEEAGTWLAVEKSLSGQAAYKLGERNERSISELTKVFPTQVVDIHSHLVIEGGPEYRRKFIDWGLFHVEQDFLLSWRGMQRALSQRNASLKQSRNVDSAWNEAFIKYALQVDAFRSAYVDQLSCVLLPRLRGLLELGSVSLLYECGWDKERGLEKHLYDNAGYDRASGHTSCGPHRSELLVLNDGKPVKEVLSRGQIKVFVCAMMLARTELLGNPERAVFLIDDLHAELDHSNCRALVTAIDELGCQTFITGIEEDLLCASTEGFTTNVFHVEQGEIFERV